MIPKTSPTQPNIILKKIWNLHKKHPNIATHSGMIVQKTLRIVYNYIKSFNDDIKPYKSFSNHITP